MGKHKGVEIAKPKVRIIPRQASETVEEMHVNDEKLKKRASPSYKIPNRPATSNKVGWYGDDEIQDDGKLRKKLAFRKELKRE